MKSNYTGYRCCRCKREIILLTEDIYNAKACGNYLSCAFCGSKKIKKEKEADAVKECMKHSSYKRVRGALRQVNTG